MSKRRTLTFGLILTLGLLISLGAVDFTGSLAIANGEGGAKVVVEPLPEEGDFKVEVWTDKKTYTVGESLTAFARSERAGYLTIYDFTPGGVVHVIYPNKYHTDNQIQANVIYQIPAPDDPFKLTVAPPLGEEMFVAIVTKNPGIAPLPESIEEELFPEVSRAAAEFAAEIKVVVQPREDWGLGYATFNVTGGAPPPSQPELSEEGWVYQTYREEVSGGVTIAWPIGFNPDGASQIGNSYWLHDQAFQNWSAWKFNATAGLSGAREAWLDFGLLVTNTLQGGQGYESTVKVTLKVLNVNGTVIHEQRNRVKLSNPVRPKDPTPSYGIGWQTFGGLQLPLSVIQTMPVGGKVIAKVERDPSFMDAGYQPVVGANMNGLVLRYR